MKRKSIAFIVPGLGNMGGSVRVASQLANALLEKHDVSMISCASFSEPAFPLDGRIQVRSLGIDGGRLRERVSAARAPLGKILEGLDIDVLFGIGTYETLMAVLPCRRSGTKLVFCDHGALINQWDDKQMRVIRLLDAFFSTKTVVLTRRSLADYRRLLHVPEKKLTCIPNWISDEQMMLGRSYDPSSKKLMWAGRLDREKGVDHLLEIASRVLPGHPDWVWDVYGEEVDANSGIDVRREISERGLALQLHLKGRVDNLYELYGRYAACTLTSYREGLPLTLLEGKAAGLPLVSFDVATGPADIIEDGVNGFLVKPYDCDEYASRLSQLMEDVSLRALMSENSVVGLEAFSESVVLGRWLALVDEVERGK